MQLSKNMIKNYFTIFCKKMSIFVRNSSNFLHTIFIPQATIGTKNPGNSTTNTAKITPFFYKRREKIVNNKYDKNNNLYLHKLSEGDAGRRPPEAN